MTLTLWSALRVTTLSLWVGVAGAATPAQWQSPASIRLAAEGFAARQYAGHAAVVVEAVSVDERLKLPSCAAPLDTDSQHSFSQGSGTVVVSCPGRWRLFVPVRVSMQISVVVASRDLMRGATLSRGDLELATRRSSSLPKEYLSRLDAALGSTLKRSLTAGSVLVPGALDRPRVVTRGGLVSLVSRRGGIAVKSEGLALQHAGLNDRVRVKTQSGRIVEGVVEADHLVRVGR